MECEKCDNVKMDLIPVIYHEPHFKCPQCKNIQFDNEDNGEK
jgi:hypothetical protein